MMPPVLAIDVHAHYGRYVCNAPRRLGDELMSADAAEVARRARAASIAWTIVSPLSALHPRGRADAVAGNIAAQKIVAQTPGLLQYVVIDPRNPQTFEQADEMLRLPTCVGVKIHPEEHCYPIRDYGQAIFEFAADRRAVVLTHSSEQNSLAADFVPLANEYPEVTLILAHIGCGWDGDVTHQIRAIQQSRHGNIYADTSSASSITPGLIEWAVKEAGPESILFGSDSPLYHVGMQRARIEQADLSDAAKQQVLRFNALRLFGLNVAGGAHPTMFD
jgi:predicted TIM-barrel fold metal-dependent hydrolase